MTDALPEPTVLVPAGVPLLDAAAWVGESCRLELDLHRRLTDVLAAGVGAERSTVLWPVRAHRAEVAEAWHRRLPELREMPRADFLAADAGEVDGSGAATDRTDAADLAWIAAALDALLDRYRARVEVAVGPADGPTADTLSVAIARAETDRDAVLRCP